jgi:hypothetical protein
MLRRGDDEQYRQMRQFGKIAGGADGGGEARAGQEGGIGLKDWDMR